MCGRFGVVSKGEGKTQTLVAVFLESASRSRSLRNDICNEASDKLIYAYQQWNPQ